MVQDWTPPPTFGLLFRMPASRASTRKVRGNGGEHEKAADLILAARVRSSVHHATRIENQLELEKLLVSVLRAAALIHALLKPVEAD
jgi:hypothetical protein